MKMVQNVVRLNLILIIITELLIVDINLSLWQDQYAFIHDAILEAMTCGDTRIPASDLRQVVENLTQTDEENERKTGFEQQFEVNYKNCSFPT